MILFFSLVYYGFLFPNTAYAKLNTGISQYQLWYQGLCCFQDLILRDPVTFVVIFLGLVIGKEKMKIGLVLNLLYIISIGGDFMSGRFFSLPFLVSISIIAEPSKNIKRNQ